MYINQGNYFIVRFKSLLVQEIRWTKNRINFNTCLLF